MEFDMLRKKVDFKLSNKDVKDILNRAVIDGRLEYVKGTKYQAAGYYPIDRSTELAKDAKKAKTGAKSEQNPKAKTRQKPSKNRG